MNRIENPCPHPLDIEPTCFTLNQERALIHAKGIIEKAKLPDGVRPTIGLIIPSERNPRKILYCLRDPLYSREFPDAWGLPSTTIPIEMFRKLAKPNEEMDDQSVSEAIDQLVNKKQKLPNVSLHPEEIVGWTGRIRYKRDGYDGDYYLIMIDIRTAPVDPDTIPSSSVAYTQFNWLTPEEHMKVVEQHPTRACGACSALAYQAFLQGK